MPAHSDILSACPCQRWQAATRLGIRVGQSLEELLLFYQLLRIPVKRVLEVGTQDGGWLYMLGCAIFAPAQLCAVDLVEEPAFEIAQRELRQEGFDVHMIPKPAAAALPEVERWLDGARLDLLHLDAQHTDAGAREEWDLYAPLVRPGGIVAIHDVEPTGPHAEFGAQALFTDLRLRHDTALCLRPWREGLGIGIVFMEGQNG